MATQYVMTPAVPNRSLSAKLYSDAMVEQSSASSITESIANSGIYEVVFTEASALAGDFRIVITDPTKWETDYLIGNSYRYPTNGNDSTNYQKATSAGYKALQYWIMGDGTYDGFATIRNNQRPIFQSYTTLNMISMVSNDIETVNIAGLT